MESRRVKRNPVGLDGGGALGRWREDRVLVIMTAGLVALVVLAWLSYGVVGRRLIEAMYHGNLFGLSSGLLPGRSTTPLGNYYQQVEQLLWVLTLVPLLFIALAALAKAGILDRLVLSGASVLFFLFVVFYTLEIFPGLISPLGLDSKIQYYAHKRVLQPHDTLIYVYQDGTERFGSTQFKGDSYSPAYGVQTTTVEFGYWERSNGFVIGPEPRSADVVILGDSYVEAASAYRDLFGSRLAGESGLKTTTLGVGGYGPVQYLEMFKTRGVRLKPRYAIMAFFEGNDALNVKDYLGWRKGDGGYYDRVDRAWSPPLWRRYFYVLEEGAEYLTKITRLSLKLGRQRLGLGPDGIHPDLVVLNLGAERENAVFYYKTDTRSPGEMLESAEWKAFANIVKEFREISQANGIVPIILYIPAAAHVYGEFTTEESGTKWLEIREEQILAAGNQEKAMAEVARREQVKLVSLTPAFKAAAQEGRMLYYPFDSHWNSEGRQTAAEYLAQVLRPADRSGEPRKRPAMEAKEQQV